MTTVCDDVLETARGAVAALRALPPPAADTGVPVVLCPGLIGSKEDFLPLPALAAAGYRAYAYDYRGHYGASCDASADALSDRDHSIRRHADDLLAVLDAVAGGGDAGTPHVVGHSYGGFVVRAAALADPGRLRSAALIGCGPGMDSPKHRKILGGFDHTLSLQGNAVMWPVVRRLIPEDDTARREFWRTRLRLMRPAFVRGALEALAGESDRADDLRATRLALLVLHGHRDRKLWSSTEFAGYAERAGASLAVIDGASHSPNLEQPGPTAEALLRFWAETDRRRALRTFVDLVRPSAHPDPYPAYARLRGATPVLPVQLPGKTEAVVLTRYADCARLLQDATFVSAGEAPDLLTAGWREHRLVRCLYQSFGWREGAAHLPLRTALARRLTPRRCPVQHADVVDVATRVLDGFAVRLAGGATVNLADAVAVPFASLVTGRLLGIPDADALRLGVAARAGSAAFEPFITPRQRTAMAAAGDTIIDTLAAHAALSGGGLLDVVRAHRPDGGEQYHGDLTLLFGAAYDSPASLVTLGARLLLTHPAQAALLREDPSLAEQAVEEILRYDPPVQVAVRIATVPCSFGDVAVSRGTALLGILGAANRDPAYTSDPDEFRILRRTTRPPLSFGAGRHYCPGSALARTHARVLFPMLLRRFPGLRLAGPPRFRSPGTMLRGVEDLPVVLDECETT
ncbi:alpha/beta fold hydrolase [Dactylosporangium sp. NBC_01737]|uniref:alpha/beta fold hydrolase n=1 Tax=Dactylosporangium sp. NBC_01737 TaxID=2975959 RepID=UPI002E0FDBE2|nr:alpha/beta fold hydrolase [Dactylosporangium sp. NBC_01737]